MRNVDQTIGDDWRNRGADEYLEGKKSPLTSEEWEREYSEFCDTEMFGGVNASFDQVFKVLR
jgi:hypothetical protein